MVEFAFMLVIVALVAIWTGFVFAHTYTVNKNRIIRYATVIYANENWCLVCVHCLKKVSVYCVESNEDVGNIIGVIDVDRATSEDELKHNLYLLFHPRLVRMMTTRICKVAECVIAESHHAQEVILTYQIDSTRWLGLKDAQTPVIVLSTRKLALHQRIKVKSLAFNSGVSISKKVRSVT